MSLRQTELPARDLSRGFLQMITKPFVPPHHEKAVPIGNPCVFRWGFAPT